MKSTIWVTASIDCLTFPLLFVYEVDRAKELIVHKEISMTFNQKKMQIRQFAKPLILDEMSLERLTKKYITHNELKSNPDFLMLFCSNCTTELEQIDSLVLTTRDGNFTGAFCFSCVIKIFLGTCEEKTRTNIKRCMRVSTTISVCEFCHSLCMPPGMGHADIGTEKLRGKTFFVSDLKLNLIHR